MQSVVRIKVHRSAIAQCPLTKLELDVTEVPGDRILNVAHLSVNSDGSLHTHEQLEGYTMHTVNTVSRARLRLALASGVHAADLLSLLCFSSSFSPAAYPLPIQSHG